MSQIHTLGGKREMTVINESGLYSVILCSDNSVSAVQILSFKIKIPIRQCCHIGERRDKSKSDPVPTLAQGSEVVSSRCGNIATSVKKSRGANVGTSGKAIPIKP